MVVQCNACNTKFRLDDSKVKDKAVKVRCTKCQNVFMVAPPPPSEEAAPKQGKTSEVSFGAQPEPSPKTEGIDLSGFSEQSAPQKQEEKKEEASQWGMDFTFDEKPEEEKKAEWDIGLPSSKEDAPFSFEEKKEAVPSPEPSGFSFEEGFTPAAEKTSFEIEPPQTEEEFVVPPKEEAKTLIMGAQSKGEAKTLIMESPLSPKAQTEANEVSFKTSSEKRKISAPIIISAVIILLLAAGGGVVYLNRGTGFLSKPAAPQKTMDIIGLQGYYINNTSVGQLFVMEGKLVSNLNTLKEITGIHGMIFDKMGKTIKDAWVAPGRIVPRDELKAISAADLEKRFKDRNGTVPPKGTVPFMIVFQGVSGELSEFSVEIGQ